MWKSYVNKIGEMIFNDKYLISEIFRRDSSNFQKFKEYYETNLIKFKSDNRFPIPIIGKISSGKSTFLNSILQGNYLSSNINIDTKFICIIRDNRQIEFPTFYKCELKKKKIDYDYKNIYYYYFEKKDKLNEKNNILENIKAINEDLKNYEKVNEKEKRDINKYFYILELKNPLFNSNKELGEYFDLMDIPGLNEKDDFYLKNIIPIIVDKCLFSIYIFDLTKYENENSLDVYKQYTEQLNKIYNSNSIYILNKIDYLKNQDMKIKDPNDHLDKFKKLLSKPDFNVDLNNNFFLKLSSIELFNKVNSDSNLKTYILYIIDNISIEEKNNDLFDLLGNIKKNFKECFNLSEEELDEILNDTNINNYKDYYDEKEFEEITEEIINKGLNLESEQKEDLFQKFKFIMNKKERNILSIQELKEVYETIHNSMCKSLEKFFDLESY